MKRLIFIIIAFALISCKTHSQSKEINPLDKAINYFDSTLTKNEKDSLKLLSEDEFENEQQWNLTSWMKNNWFKDLKDTSLIFYFNKLGINRVDDMCSIILTSLHRKLNNKPIDFDAQVEMYVAHWKPYNDCQKKQMEKALLYYNQFKIGDTITIIMKVEIFEDQRNAVIPGCPDYGWTFDPTNDLEIQGIVNDKYFKYVSPNAAFKVKIIKMNFPNTKILMEEVKVGDIIEMHLKGLTIKPK